MKKGIIFLALALVVLSGSYLLAQTSPDYIFGDDYGSGWSWTTGTPATPSLGNSYKWQFQANANGNLYFKFGETSSNADGQGFWYVGSGEDVQYPGPGNFGDMWIAYYHANMGEAGAFYFAVTSGNYYVIKSRIRSDGNADFAVFYNTQAPVTITSVTRTLSGLNLYVDVTLSGAKTSQEKVWVRYSTDNWNTSTTVEANTNTGGNTWRATISLSPGRYNVSYYAFTTLNLSNAPSDPDFYTINYDNNNGQNYSLSVISGDYYIGAPGTRPGGGDPDFSSLRAAVDFINASVVGGNCTFYFTSNLTETQNSFMGVNTNGYTLTFRPYYDNDITISFTKSSDNTSSSGGWIIGLNSDSWTPHVKTDNIVIDGYAPGGTTRRLTIQARNSDGAHNNTAPIVIIGDCDNITIKNAKIIYQPSANTLTIGAIWVRLSTRVSPEAIPDNITVENCEIVATGGATLAGFCLTYTGTPAPTGKVENVIVRNNVITAQHRGIFLNHVGNSEYYNNEIYIRQTGTGYLSSGIHAFVSDAGKNIKIYNNKILQLRTANSTTTSPLSYGIAGIRVETVGNYEIYNNFITGFELTATSPRGQYHGITIATGSTLGIRAKVYNNTVLVNDVRNLAGTAHTDYRISAFYLNYSGASGTREADVRNNIFISNETGSESQCFYWANTSLATLTTNYNLFYFADATNGYVGRTGTINRKALSHWQDALQGMPNVTGKDANSVSKNVTFAGVTDLHLSGSSLYDLDLLGTPISGVTTDIDGDSRHSTTPYKGADEVVPRPVVSVAKVYDRGGLGTTPGATDVPMLGINFNVSNGWAILSGLAVQKFVNNTSRTLAGDGEVTLKAYVDVNGNDQVDGSDTYLGSASFSANVAVLNFSSSQTINVGIPLRILLAVDVANTANPSHWVALKVNDPSNVTITSVAEKSSDNYPLQNSQDTPLPVQVTNVSAEVKGNIVKLRIKTQVESSEFLGFDIYRSRDNVNYALIGSYLNYAGLKSKGAGAFGSEYEFVDKGIEGSGKYYYRIEAVSKNERKLIDVMEVEIEVPKRYVLHQNYPNPFNPVTTIEFELPVGGNVVLELYNSSGQKVLDIFRGELPSGYYKIKFDGSNLSSGVYFYVLRANDFVGVKKMVLVK